MFQAAGPSHLGRDIPDTATGELGTMWNDPEPQSPSPWWSRIARVTSVGAPVVLNSRPLTETVLPTVREPSPEKSMKSIPDRVTTLIVVTGGVAPVNNGDSPVKVSVPLSVLMLPTCPVTCEGHRRTRSVVTVVVPPLDDTVPGRICTS